MGAKRPKFFLSPPMSSSEGDGGGHFGCPPPEMLRRGTILRGGDSLPRSVARGGRGGARPPLGDRRGGARMHAPPLALGPKVQRYKIS